MIRHNQTPKTSDAQRKYMKKYYKRNKAKLRKKHKAYYQANRDEILKKEKANRDPEKKWEYQVQYKFENFSAEQYRELLKKQGGVCAICKQPPSGRFKRLAIDHCHKTGDIRGLIHTHCNRALGLFKDDPVLLRAAADYIEAARRRR